MRRSPRRLIGSLALAVAWVVLVGCAGDSSAPDEEAPSPAPAAASIELRAGVSPWERVTVSGETSWSERFVEVVPCIGTEPGEGGLPGGFEEATLEECDETRTLVTRTDERGHIADQMTIPPVVNYGNRGEWDCIEQGCHLRLVAAPRNPVAAWAAVSWADDAVLAPQPVFQARWQELNGRQALTLTSRDFAPRERISLMQCAEKTATGVNGETCTLPRQAVVGFRSGRVMIRVLPVRTWQAGGKRHECAPGTETCFFALLTPDRRHHNRMTTVDIPATADPAFGKPPQG